MHQVAMPFSPEGLQTALNELPAARRWWVAFSGGADSTALLHALVSLRDQLSGEILALHVDHGLHKDSESWRATCEQFCRQHGVRLHAERVEVPRSGGKGLEAEARRLRYEVAKSILQDEDILLTGHHADDQAETLLLNLMRGSGVDGLAGMPILRRLGAAWLARPLLEFDGASLRAYLTERGVGWVEDSSNRDPAYDRNFVRQHLIPLLEQRWSAARRNLIFSAAYCREASDLLTLTARERLEACAFGPVLDLGCLRRQLPGSGRHRGEKLVLREWLRENNAPSLPGDRLNELERQLSTAGPEQHVAIRWNGWVMQLHRNRLWLQKEASIVPCPAATWSTRTPLALDSGLGTLRLKGKGALPNWQLMVRSRMGGERLACLPGGHHKSIKKLMHEASLPPWLRASIPLIYEQDTPVALADWAVAADFRERLNQQGLRLEWQPDDPLLQYVASHRQIAEVDRG